MGKSSSVRHSKASMRSTTSSTSVSVKMPPPQRPPDYRRMDSRSYRYFRRLQPFLFCLALVVALLGYAFFGAAVFVYLEGENERQSFQTLMGERASFLELVNASIEAAASAGEAGAEASVNFTAIDAELFKFEGTVKRLRNLDPDGKPMWNYFGALFFSATVISTIGYGNIAPVTIGGRVFCMIYAVFGIAMLLLVLASIGSLFARGATLTYRLLNMNIKMAKGAPPPKPVKKTRAVRVPAEGEEGEEGVALAAKRNGAQDARAPSMEDVIRDIWSQDPELEQGDMPPMRVMAEKGTPGAATAEEAAQARAKARGQAAAREAEDEDDEDDVDIPLTIVLLFALAYVCLLAAMLSLWEDQWNYFEAFYFSFVTLTTIGFGDLVPKHQKNLLGCTFFILLGMAIMSMCIALAQKIIMKKVAWISERVGVALIKARPT